MVTKGSLSKTDTRVINRLGYNNQKENQFLSLLVISSNIQKLLLVNVNSSC